MGLSLRDSGMQELTGATAVNALPGVVIALDELVQRLPKPEF